MQNNAAELTQRLLRALDNNYNVTDMPAVIEIISLLEKVAVTKELLETTRLGKHINQVRRRTSDESLAKRTKDLVKKWRDIFLPDSNGQEATPTKKRSVRDVSLEPAVTPKRPRFNGQISELEFSDNSNSSFKDVQVSSRPISINSDSNSQEPEPKKRGRKKGSKNHRNLLEEAESSFSSKLNSSRGNARVKTTQELLADLQIKSSPSLNLPAGRPVEDLNEKAAKLTQRVSIIDQKLNANSNRFRNSTKRKGFSDNVNVIESGVVSNVKREATFAIKKEEPPDEEDDVIVVDDVDDVKEEIKVEEVAPSTPPPEAPRSLSVEEALALLPPVDKSVLWEDDPEPSCTCQLIENKTDFSVEEDEEDVNLQHTFEFVEDEACPAKAFLRDKYRLDPDLLEEQVKRLHQDFIPNVNGNVSVGECKPDASQTADGLYVNIVPNVHTERLPKCQPSENFQKYSISETFREWHEVVETRSYDDDDTLRILPYVVID